MWTRRNFIGCSMAIAALPTGACAQRTGDNKPQEGRADVEALKGTRLSRPIPKTGEEIPVIGLGTWQAFDIGAGGTDWADAKRALDLFLRSGGRLIDSSPMYGRSEEVIGRLLSEDRQAPKPFLATKVWTSGRREGLAQIEESFRLLQTPVIDLLQVHNLLDFDTHLGALTGLKQSGRVRYIGATHYHAGAYDALEKVLQSGVLDFVQLNYSVAEREAEARLLPLAGEKGVAVIANRPFAGGDVFAEIRRKPLPSFAGELACTSWAQLLLKYVVSDPRVTCAIPGTRNPRHVVDNLRAASEPLPDAALRRRIVEAALG